MKNKSGILYIIPLFYVWISDLSFHVWFFQASLEAKPDTLQLPATYINVYQYEV